MGSGRGRGQGSSGLGSGLELVGVHCSTAPPDSPPLTGGSWPETWSGAGVWSQVWGSATPYLEVWRGLDCVKPHLNAAAARPSTILSLVRLGRRSTNERAAWPGGGDGARSFPAGFFPLPGQRVRDRGQMSKFFSFIFLETPLVGRDRKIEARSGRHTCFPVYGTSKYLFTQTALKITLSFVKLTICCLRLYLRDILCKYLDEI